MHDRCRRVVEVNELFVPRVDMFQCELDDHGPHTYWDYLWLARAVGATSLDEASDYL